MVDRVSGNYGNPIQDGNLLGVKQQQDIEKTNIDSAREAQTVSSLQQYDKASISDEAKLAYERDKEVLKFSRLAQRVRNDVDLDKVSQMKNLIDSGRINDYLRSLNTEALADSILNGPGGSFLR